MDKPREFECVDCGVHVYTFLEPRPVPAEPNLCAVCDFLRTVDDDAIRQELRRALQGDKNAERKN